MSGSGGMWISGDGTSASQGLDGFVSSFCKNLIPGLRDVEIKEAGRNRKIQPK